MLYFILSKKPSLTKEKDSIGVESFSNYNIFKFRI